MTSQDDDITQLLAEASDGNQAAVDRILPLVYPELQAMAQRHLRTERDDHTLDTAALVHEAYLKLAGQDAGTWENRVHFFRVAAQAMRRILVTHAHARNAQKRGGGDLPLPLDETQVAAASRSDELIALDEALDGLASFAERPARVVELWFFGGLTQTEIAEVLGISEPTVRRDWRVARAWLTRALGEVPAETAALA